MFGKKKAKKGGEGAAAEKKAPASNGLTLTAQLIASNRFKTWCCFVLFIVVIFQCVFAGVLLRREKVIVGITPEGRPELLLPVSAELSLDLYVRDFVSRFFNFSPSTVRENITYASDFMTGTLSGVYEKSMGPAFFNDVARLGVVQMTSVRDVKIRNLSDSGFTAHVTAGRLKSDNVEKQTIEQTLYITIKAVKGPLTVKNGWGYYVDEIKESLTRPEGF